LSQKPVLSTVKASRVHVTAETDKHNQPIPSLSHLASCPLYTFLSY